MDLGRRSVLRALSPGQTVVVSLLSIVVIGALDHATGYELAFSIF